MSDLSEQIKHLAQGAVVVARDTYRVHLDYSEESLKRLEYIFDALHRDSAPGFFTRIFRRKLTEEQINFAAMALGAYIGETVQKLYGGTWSREKIAGDEDVVTLSVGDIKIFPLGKAYKRIVNGREDDIWFFYQVFTKDLPKIPVKEASGLSS